MKLTEFLIITWSWIIVTRSEIAENDQRTLLRRAAEQLERLEPYRRITEDRESEFSNLLKTWKSSVDQNQLDGTKSNAGQNTSWEMSKVSPEAQTESDASKRIDDKKLITVSVITDPRYVALMRDRIKRGFDVGSGSLLTSIAGGVITGVASASSGSAAKASAGSSNSGYKPIYSAPTVEHTYSYEEKPFGPWEFKKAIFSTLFQALKAIGGGVLALKGQLVKGSGYLLTGKGKVVSKAGDVITSFGKHLAASALPKPYSETYYDHSPIQHIEHESSYSGPPSSSNDFSEVPTDFSHYNVPSDDNGQGGLLIVTPAKSDLDKYSDQHMNAAIQEKPDPIKLAENFGGPTKSSIINNLLNSVPKGSIGSKDQTPAGQDNIDNSDNKNNNNMNSSPVQHLIYDIPINYPANHDNPTYNYEQNYPIVQDGNYHKPELPHIASHTVFSNLGVEQNLSTQSNPEYSLLQQIQYPNSYSSLLDPRKLPHDDGGTSVYAGVSVDTEPQMTPLKVSFLGESGAFDLPKFQPYVDSHGQSQFTNPLDGSSGGPLKIPLLNSIPSSYFWQGQGSLVPTSALDTLDHFHKRNVLQKRILAKRLARYASLQKRLHRL